MVNVLVCDDEKDIVSALRIYLESEGYQVYTAYDGIEALEVLETKEISSTGIGPFLRPAANFSIADFWNLTCGPSKITSTSSKTLGASENGNAKIFASYPASLAAPSILVTNKLVDIPAEQTNKICFIFNTPSHL